MVSSSNHLSLIGIHVPRKNLVWILCALTAATLYGTIASTTSHEFVSEKPAGIRLTDVDVTGSEWQFLGPEGVATVASVPLQTQSFSLIWVRLGLGRVTGDVSPLAVDLMGPNYVQNEFITHVSTRDENREIRRLLYTAVVPRPDDTVIRLYESSGSPLSVRRLATTSIHLGFLVPFLLSAALLISMGVTRIHDGFAARSGDSGFADKVRWTLRTGQQRLSDANLLVPVGLALVVCCLIGKVSFLAFPLLPSDEFLYAFRSKFGWRAFAGEEGMLAPVLTNLLYFRLFEPVHAFDGYTLVAARALNTLLMGLATIPMYRIFHRVVGVGSAALLTLLFCVGPTAFYAGYFMPESTYYLGFWLVMLAFARFIEQPKLASVAVLAVALAALSLVKTHGIAVVVCIAATLPFLPFFQSQGPRFGRFIALSAALVALFCAAWVCLASALAGELILNPTPQVYSKMVSEMLDQRSLFESIQLMRVVTMRHLSIVYLLFALPVGLVLAQLAGAFRRPAQGTQSAIVVPFGLVGLVIIGVLIVMSSRQVIWALTIGDPYSTIDRLQGRYYSFALPLLVLASASPHALALLERPWRARLVAVGLGTVFLGLAFWVAQSTPVPYVVDYPEAFALLRSRLLLHFSLAGGLVVALLAMVRPRWTWSAYLIFLTLVTAGASSWVYQGELERAAGSDVDRMGMTIRLLLTESERDALVSYSKGGDARSHLLGLHLVSRARFRVATDLSNSNCSAIPAEARYVVTLVSIPVACGFSPVLKIGETTLFSRDKMAPPKLVDK